MDSQMGKGGYRPQGTKQQSKSTGQMYTWKDILKHLKHSEKSKKKWKGMNEWMNDWQGGNDVS